MKCKILARCASNLQEKGHFLCCNLVVAPACTAHASFLQDLLAMCARYTCKFCKNHGLARLADYFSLGIKISCFEEMNIKGKATFLWFDLFL